MFQHQGKSIRIALFGDPGIWGSLYEVFQQKAFEACSFVREKRG